MKPEVFISYSTANLAIAEAIRSAFEGAGVSCWIATEAIREGGDWAAQIPPAISACEILLLILSSAASASPQVTREVHLAMQQHKRVIPYRVDAAEPSGALQYFLAGMQRVDASEEDPAGRIGDLLERTRRVLLELKSPAALPEAQITAPNNLPKTGHHLVGRAGDLADIRQGLLAQRIVTVVGPGGVGKTTLAIEAARLLIGGFPQGAWYVELAPIADEALATSAIASALPDDKDARVLLLLDNCEHVLSAVSATVQEAVNERAGLVVLATSREALGLRDESVYQLAPLPLPVLIGGVPTIDELNASPAASLFLERASEAGETDLERDTERAAVAEICKRLDGLPLALELAAARASSLSFEQIAKAIDQRFKLLTRGARDAAAHHKTLAALIDWSFDLLSGPEQAIFLRLGIFPGRFTLADVGTSVCADVAEFELLDAIETFIRRSLLVATAISGGQKQYNLLESVRAYLRERLEAGGDYANLARKVASRGAELSSRAAADEHGKQFLDASFDNVRFALVWYGGDGHDVGVAAKMVAELCDLWIESGRWSEGSFWTGLLLEKRESLPTPLLESVLLTAAAICGYNEEHDAQIRHYQAALTLAEDHADRRTEARILNGLASARFYLGSFDEAHALWTKTARLLESENMPVQSAMVRKNLALIDQLVRHDYDAAEEGCTAAYRVLSEAKSNLHAALALQVLSEVAYARGDLEKARVQGESSLGHLRALGNAQYMADGNLLLAKIDFLRQSYLSSALLLREAMLTYSGELGSELADCALLSASIASRDGNLRGAAELLAFYRSERKEARLPPLEPDAVQLQSLAARLESALSEPELSRAFARGGSSTRAEIAKKIRGVIDASIDAALV
ncbi:MAG TPA: TIR domain-containing protein [Candidatus Baltobacteraceae bacterium]|nr:TIR domain-containing protein [Candidatus Baltobacteraceae bacterium]